MVEDLEDGEDVVVEEALLGRHTSHKKPLFRRYHKLATFGRYAGLSNTSKKGPSYLKEVRR